MFVLLALSASALPQNENQPSASPAEFAIGRLTFFDFGPPFDYYEVFVVHPNSRGTSVERVTLTPGSDACFLPPKVEMGSATVSESVSTLLTDVNPCGIPERDLKRELKRCKHCLTFSGARVAMQVQCGNRMRVIRSDILDRDIFDPAAKTQSNTEWTMNLLNRLDEAVGPGVMQKPLFGSSKENELPSDASASPVLADIAFGKYDPLFAGEEQKPSALYQAAMQSRPPDMRVELWRSTIDPVAFSLPIYPAIARLARVQGIVSISVLVDSNGHVHAPFSAGGPALLRASVESAAGAWVFPKEASGKLVTVDIRFYLSCVPANPWSTVLHGISLTLKSAKFG